MLSRTGTDIGLAISKKWRGLTSAGARQSPQVVGLMKSDRDTRTDAAEALGNLLSFTAQLFNVGKNLNDIQVGLLANDMLERYWHWRFDEFAFVLKEATAGKYGTAYDRIDAPTVHGWCLKYEAQRDELIEAEAQKKHKANRVAEANREKIPGEAMEVVYFKAKLAALSDEQLLAGIAYYEEHPDQPFAAVKIDTARDVLGDRIAWAQHEKNRPRNQAEDAAGMQAARVAWINQRAAEREQLADEQAGTGAEVVE